MTPTEEATRRLILAQRTVEMFGLPGDRCADAACRRRGRCRSVASQGPACLRHLDAGSLDLYQRLLDIACWGDAEPIALLGRYCKRNDPVMRIAGEIVRRAQPRGHWLHVALVSWARDCHGAPGHATLSLEAALAAPPRYYDLKTDKRSAGA